MKIDASAYDPEFLDAMRANIREELRATGTAGRLTELISVPSEVWWEVARWAARDLGRPVKTGELAGRVLAWLADWPRNDREDNIYAQKQADASEILFRHITKHWGKCGDESVDG